MLWDTNMSLDELKKKQEEYAKKALQMAKMAKGTKVEKAEKVEKAQKAEQIEVVIKKPVADDVVIIDDDDNQVQAATDAKVAYKSFDKPLAQTRPAVSNQNVAQKKTTKPAATSPNQWVSAAKDGEQRGAENSKSKEESKPIAAVKPNQPAQKSTKPAEAKSNESAKPAEAKSNESAKPAEAKSNESAKPAEAKSNESVQSAESNANESVEGESESNECAKCELSKSDEGTKAEQSTKSNQQQKLSDDLLKPCPTCENNAAQRLRQNAAKRPDGFRGHL